MFKHKKGFAAFGAVQVIVMTLTMAALIGALGIVFLDKFSIAIGGSGSGATAVNASRDAIGTIFTDWYSILVLVGVLGVALLVMMGIFGGARQGRK
jgi:hypothetical protein